VELGLELQGVRGQEFEAAGRVELQDDILEVGVDVVEAVLAIEEPWARPALMVTLTFCKSSGTPASAGATARAIRVRTNSRYFIAATPRVKRMFTQLLQLRRSTRTLA
jgi:hypothetical protein